MSNIFKHDVVCFGEVLWDILPSGSVPGGAPVNVAYHLNKQKKHSAVITRIGKDDDGKKLMEEFSKKGVTTEYFQIDEKYETGKVYAKPDENKNMVYDIVMPVAWDYILWDDSFEGLVKNAEYFVYGSLAARTKVSEETLFRLLKTANKKVLDINLRPPHFNKEIVTALLQKSDVLKMNLEELELISEWFDFHGKIEDRIKSFSEHFSIKDIVVTMGANGAILYTNGETLIHKGFKVNVVDTVGSGDAFLAGLLSCLMNNSCAKDTLEYASRLGAFVATHAGACPDYELQDIKNLSHS
jgi:fructokinase